MSERESEASIQARTMLAIGRLPDTRIFRNAVGAGWVGELVSKQGDLTILRDARHCHFGLAANSADLIGWCRGRFVALEMKTPRGRATDMQKVFLNIVAQHGGLSGICRSPEDALALLEASL
jgi:hypothetical protein